MHTVNFGSTQPSIPFLHRSIMTHSSRPRFDVSSSVNPFRPSGRISCFTVPVPITHHSHLLEHLLHTTVHLTTHKPVFLTKLQTFQGQGLHPVHLCATRSQRTVPGRWWVSAYACWMAVTKPSGRMSEGKELHLTAGIVGWDSDYPVRNTCPVLGISISII